MVTRAGDIAQSDRLQNALQAASGRIRTAQLQVATGKRATTFDGIASDAGLLLRTKQHRTLNSTYVQQNQQVTDRLNAMDGALGSLGDIASRMRTLVVQRLDSSSGPSVPLTQEADSMLAQLGAQLNLKLDDRYLFAGSRVDTPPVALPTPPATSANPALYYQGDGVIQTVRADADADVPYGVTADNPAFANLISALGTARAAHIANDRPGLQAALGQLETAVSQISTLRGQVGSTAERLTTIVDSQQQTGTYLDDIVSRIENADVPQTMTQLAQNQATLEAAYLTTSRLSQLSLADYLR